MVDEAACPFLGVQIELIGRQWTVRRRGRVLLALALAGQKLAARRIIIRDQFEPRGLRFLRLMRKKHKRTRHVIEQRVELGMEQWKPMLHALMLAAGADETGHQE